MGTRRGIAGWMTVVMILGQLAIIWIKDRREHGAAVAIGRALTAGSHRRFMAAPIVYTTAENARP